MSEQPPMKKYKFLLEFVSKKETLHGAINLEEFHKISKIIDKIAKEINFDCYVKWYPKEKLDYVPTQKEYHIKTVEDIQELTEQQFEFFIEDLRNWCNIHRGIKEAKKILWDCIQEQWEWMIWLDTWLNEQKINVEITNKH